MIVFAASATGGHLYPAIALAQEMAIPCHFIVSSQQVVPRLFKQYPYPVTAISFAFNRPWRFWKAWRISVKLMKKEKVRLLVSTGGIVTIPVVMAAKYLGIPVILHEQNVIPGRANRLLQGLALDVVSSFPEASDRFSREVRCLGLPVRKQFADDGLQSQLRVDQESEDPLLLVFGGSQGAHAINNWIREHYSFFKENPYRLIHVTGESYFKKHYPDQDSVLIKTKEGRNAIRIFPYFERMDHLCKVADLVLCRAGASSIFECAAFNTYGIFVPYPYAKDNHQVYNAEAAKHHGVGEMMTQDDLDFERIIRYLDARLKPQFSQMFPRDARETISALIRGFYDRM